MGDPSVSADFDVFSAATVWGLLSEQSAGEAARPALIETTDELDELVRFSLADVDPVSRRYRLHALVREAADGHLSEAVRRQATVRHAWFYQWALGEIHRRYTAAQPEPRAAFDLLDAEWTNVLAAWAWSISAAPEDETAARYAANFAQAGVYVLPFRMSARDRTEWYEGSLSAARRLGDLSILTDLLTTLGTAYGELGDFDRAIALHTESRSLASRLEDPQLEMNAIGNLANAYARRGGVRNSKLDVDEAVGLQQQVLAFAIATNDDDREARAHLNLGITFMEFGESRLALGHFHSAHEAALRIGNREIVAMALGNIGAAHRSLSESGQRPEELDLALNYLCRGRRSRRTLATDGGYLPPVGTLPTRFMTLGDTPKQSKSTGISSRCSMREANPCFMDKR